MLIREQRKPDLQMSYEIQNRQIVESVEVEKVLRVHDGKTFVVDQSVRPENVERELVRMRATLTIPFFVDDFGVAVGVEAESFV